MAHLTKLVLERLMQYYRILSDSKFKEPRQTVTSAQIAEALDIDPTQVRKDLGAIGVKGMGRVGFDVCQICHSIRVALGFDRRFQAVLIGNGHLGHALLAYPGFEKYGLSIVAAFDNDKRRTGGNTARCPVNSMRAMTRFIQRRKIRLAILATPSQMSQGLADRLVAAGVKAIWNFTPTRLKVPSGVLVRNEHISVGLSEIAYHLKQSTNEKHGGAACALPIGTGYPVDGFKVTCGPE